MINCRSGTTTVMGRNRALSDSGSSVFFWEVWRGGGVSAGIPSRFWGGARAVERHRSAPKHGGSTLTCAPNVPRVHCDEDCAPLFQRHRRPVRRHKREIRRRQRRHQPSRRAVHVRQPSSRQRRLLALRVDHRLELHAAHRQDLGHKTIEFVEAAPSPAARQALENVAHGAVVHLWRAVEHVDGPSQRSRQIFGRLGLACACGTCGRGAEAQPGG